VKDRFIFDVVVWESEVILKKLLSSEDESLLIRRDTFLVLNHGFDFMNSVRHINKEVQGLSSKGLEKDLQTTSEFSLKDNGRILLNIVVRENAIIFKFLSSWDEYLLRRTYSFLAIDYGLDSDDSVSVFYLNVKSDCFACKFFINNSHVFFQVVVYLCLFVWFEK